MSIKCPLCQAEINSDAFGLITCPSCGGQIVVGMDDEIANADASHDEIQPQIESQTEASEAASAPEPIDNETVSPTEIKSVEPTNNAGDLADIAEYGNSPESQAREGLLRFNICLTNIDTSDVRKSVREVLEDPRFLFDVEAILHSIRDGEVKISDVTPVKAAVLIQRLRGLPVGITWEQYAIHSP